MISLSRRKQQGAATLLVSVILITTVTLIVLFAASYALMQQKITANQYRHNEALAAAEAGMEFGIQYLEQNNSTILANPVGGYIPAYSDSNTNNVTLANNSRYTIVYSNPIANNYDLIQITSTGTSADGTSTQVVRQQVQFGSILDTLPTAGLTGKSFVSLSGNASVVNTVTNNTILSGDNVSLSGSSSTTTSTGGSTPGDINADIQQNVASIDNQSSSDFFASYFGVSSNTVKNSADHYYSSGSIITNYSNTLDGMTGTTVWIDQTSGIAVINGNTTIGSAANPVLLIVNGPLLLAGTVNIYGLVYTTGIAAIIAGNINIYGAMVTTSALAVSGDSTLTYDPTVLTNLRNSSSTRYFAKVPGSWRDF